MIGAPYPTSDELRENAGRSKTAPAGNRGLTHPQGYLQGAPMSIEPRPSDIRSEAR